MAIQRIGVVGAGTMGNGIAQVFAQAGFEVRLVDAAAGALDRAKSSIEKSLAKLVEKSRLTARSATRRSIGSRPAPTSTPSPTATTSSRPSSRIGRPSSRSSRGSIS